jgi:hypothetical protein
LLIGSIVPTTFAGHRFWQVQDPESRLQQRMQFMKNLGLLGGLLLDLFGPASLPAPPRRDDSRELNRASTTVDIDRAPRRSPPRERLWQSRLASAISSASPRSPAS